MKYLLSLVALICFSATVFSTELSRDDFILVSQIEKNKSDIKLILIKLDEMSNRIEKLEKKPVTTPAPKDNRPARPAGEGWQWDGRTWWRYSTQQAQQVPTYYGGSFYNGASCVGGT